MNLTSLTFKKPQYQRHIPKYILTYIDIGICIDGINSRKMLVIHKIP